MEIVRQRITDWSDETQTLDLSGLDLTELPELPDKLTKLNCSYNQLVEFNFPLPENLTYLNCSHNQLEELPSLPETLTYLNCSHNNLLELPIIPLRCEYLLCSYNRLSVISGLPDSLRNLDFFGNHMPNEPTQEMLNLPNIKNINGGSIKSGVKNWTKSVAYPAYDSPPKTKLGICLDGSEPYRIEYYLSKSKDNVVTGLNDFFNCCKRTKLGKGSEEVLYRGISYYYIPCVERWINKLDLLKIRNARFCIYNFLDSDTNIDGMPVSIVIPYTLKEYEETN